MSINYTNTLEKQFIMNPPWVLKNAWKLLESNNYLNILILNAIRLIYFFLRIP